jgi:transglutaminase-like putative cysteine protease
MSKFKIRHITKYAYEVPVRDSANQIILYPIKDAYQDVLQHSIQISGAPVVEMHTDYYGNDVGTFTHSKPHNELVIDSRVVVVTKNKPMPTVNLSKDDQWKFYDSIAYQVPYIDFLKIPKAESLPEIEALISQPEFSGKTPLELANLFCSHIYTNFIYRKGITTVETTIDEIWKIKSGVCQDFAHMLSTMLRKVKIPARYVSGYICPHKNGMRGEGATHAWVEAYIPDYGWIGIDPTNNVLVNETHVRLAVGKNFPDCSPVKGTYRGTSNHTLEVAVSVEYEDGSVNSGEAENVLPEPQVSYSQNSFRRFQEMQQQQ